MSDTAKNRFYPSKKKKKPHDVGQIKYIDINGNLGEPTGGFWSSENRAYLDLLTIKSLFQSEDWVFLATDAIAHPISTLPLKVFRKIEENDEIILKPNMSHKINKIIDNPNQFTTTCEFLYGLAADYVLAGNCYAWKGDGGGLYHIPAENILYRWGDNHIPDGYYIISDFEDAIPLPQFQVDLDEIAHTKRPNPSSSLYGLTPFAPAKRSILFNRYSQEYLNNFYLKGATPQMLLELERDAQDKSLNRLQATFEQSFTGRRNQRRTMILPKGVSAKTIENKIADQNIIELIENNADRILSVLKIPKHVVGRQASGSLGSEEMKGAMRYFWQTTITDTAKAIEQSLTKLFKPYLGEENVLCFDFENVSELQEDVNQKADLSNKMLGFMTLNEIRENYWNLPPVDGGDVILSLKETEQMQLTPEMLMGSKKKTVIDPEKVKEKIKQVDESIRGIEKEKYESRYTAALGLLVKQNLEAVNLLKEMAKEKINLDSDDFEKKLIELYEKLKKDYLDGQMDDLQGVTDLGFDQQVNLYITSDNNEAVAAAKERTKEGRYKLLEERSLFSFESIRDTTLDSVMKEITIGLEQKLSIAQVEENIKQYFKKNSVWRANTVARTETLQALTVGQQSVFDEARKTGIEFNKVWVTAQDERVRATHIAMNRNSVADNEAFIVDKPSGGTEELMYPRDPQGSAANVINCRCTVLMVPVDEELELDF